MVMDYRVIFSPLKGFWSDQGWQRLLSLATKLPNQTEVVLSFKDTDDIQLIRRKDIQVMTCYAFLTFLLKVCFKRALDKRNYTDVATLLNKRIECNGELLTIDGIPMSHEDAERHVHASIWGNKPTVEMLSEWGRRLLTYHVAQGDKETVYVISLSSPASATWLKCPERYRA